ncbi:MAG: hypothetical protein JNM56_36940 [Planctomycetia bacterium]|nr:hypothetical protein [Planctomycetia bacterium]
MDHSTETPRPAKPHLDDNEDPHYHDEDPEPNPDDRERRTPRLDTRQPPRRIPPPPRRRLDD